MAGSIWSFEEGLRGDLLVLPGGMDSLCYSICRPATG